MQKFPRFYPILDAEVAGERVLEIAEALSGAGAKLVQFRDKKSSPRRVYERCVEIRRILGAGVRLVVNDRADIAAMCEAGGVHVGQEDLRVEEARGVLECGVEGSGAAEERKWVGVSTHNLEQLKEADKTSAEYVAIGPVFTTGTKRNPDPVVGLEFVARARALTRKPLVAIGGITLENAADVWRAGADSVAVIGDVIGAKDPKARAQEYLALAGANG
jgi:thiamine-phosphate pyrophosphorylase